MAFAQPSGLPTTGADGFDVIGVPSGPGEGASDTIERQVSAVTRTDPITYEDTRPANEPATFGRRAVAWGVDSTILFFIWFIALLIPGIFYNTFPEQRDLFRTVGVVILLSLPLYWFGCAWWFNARGRSPGKRLLFLAIEKDAGTYLRPQMGPPGSGAGFIRTLGQAIGLVPLGLGYWWAVWDGRNEAWHDKMAGTQVVKLQALPSLTDGRSPPWPLLPRTPFRRRAVAYLIDVGALLGLMGAVFVLSAIFHGIFPDGRPFVYVAAVLSLAAPAYWFSYFWWSNSSGRSLGKRMMNLAALCRSRGPPGFVYPGPGRGFKRTLGQLLGIVPLGLGYWWAAWDGNGQAWHDKIAGTSVVALPKPARATTNVPEIQFKMQAPAVGISLVRTALWLLGIYALLAVTTKDVLPWEHAWPLLLVAVVSIGLAVLASRFRFLRGDVKLNDKGLAWSPDGQSASLIRYGDIRGIQVDLEGAVAVTFMSSWSSTRRLWFQEPTEKTVAFDLEDPQGFVQALQARVEAVQGEQLPVVR